MKTGEASNVDVKVHNYSNNSQTRNVRLLLNGVNTGIGQLITLAPGSDGTVSFSVTPTTAGMGTLMATLYPGDSNPSNDSLSKTVKIKEGKNKDKGKDK